MKRGLVVGCGGTVGGAWALGALAAAADAMDWDPRTADVIVGTSAGATLAALLGAGIGIDELLMAHRGAPGVSSALRELFTSPPRPVPAVPWGRPSLRLVPAGVATRTPLLALAGLAPRGRSDTTFLDRPLATLLPEPWVAHPATWLVAVDASTGARTAFGHPSAPPASIRDAVRASWAIPGWFAPAQIGGRRYLDGGAASTASADLLVAADLDEILVVAPMASLGRERAPGLGGRVEALMRRTMSRKLDRELDLLMAAGQRVIRIHPTREALAQTGANFMKPSRRIPALEAGLRTPTPQAMTA